MAEAEILQEGGPEAGRRQDSGAGGKKGARGYGVVAGDGEFGTERACACGGELEGDVGLSAGRNDDGECRGGDEGEVSAGASGICGSGGEGDVADGERGGAHVK